MAAHAFAIKQNLRSAKLDLRVKPADKQKIAEAAQLTHRKVTDFILDAALSQADQMLADRRTFNLGAKAWIALQEALDAPPRMLSNLKALMEEPGFFDA